MIFTSNPQNKFITDFSKYEKVGFHGTTLLAAPDIEKYGLLPRKIFDQATHDHILSLCQQHSISIFFVGGYLQWLGMRSVSFGVDAQKAIQHMKRGNGGGQGLMNMIEVLSKLMLVDDDEAKKFSQRIIKKIDEARQSPCIVYAVDLSRLGPPLVHDTRETLQYFFNSEIPLPDISLIEPWRLIERLDLT
jgi:hypothetical protein